MSFLDKEIIREPSKFTTFIFGKPSFSSIYTYSGYAVIPRLWRQVLNAGNWTLDLGLWKLEARLWVLKL